MKRAMDARVSTESVAYDSVRMLTYAEVATLLRVDKRTVRRRVANGRYTAYGEGSGKRILYHSILDDIERTSGEAGYGEEA